jgi:sortase A
MLLRRVLGVTLLLTSVGLMGNGLWIQVKARLAQELLDLAWHQTRTSGESVRPWPWADFWPVASLEFPEQQSQLIVLSGDNGSALAFGPGWNTQSAGPGENGVTMISGHRDTHFRVLADIGIDDVVRLQNKGGPILTYRVRSIEIVDSRIARVSTTSSVPTLVLVTCYPFDALVAGGPMRLLVIAEKTSSRTMAPDPEATAQEPTVVVVGFKEGTA